MGKGFSTFELAVIIACAGIAFNGATKDGPISFANIKSQIHSTYELRDTVYADKYLRQVANALEKVNNS